MMLQKQLLFFTTLFLFTGCVERGFELTVNQTTHTVSAIKSVDIRDKNTQETQSDIEQMNEAVANLQKKQPMLDKSSTKKPHIKTKSNKPKRIKIEEIVKKDVAVKKSQNIVTVDQAAKALENEQKRKSLAHKLAQEQEAQRLAAEKERQLLLAKEKAAQVAQAKREEALQTLKEEKEKKALALKLAAEKEARARQAEAAKVALEAKIAKEKALQLKKSQEAKAALEAKIAAQKKLAAAKEAARQATEKQAALRKQEALAVQAEKLRKQREAAARAAKEKKNIPIKTVATLHFKPSTQTYQKFGTSEIHGHVVYLTPSGQEIHLQNTKIYLVPKNTTTDYWYANYYLQNKDASSLANSTVRYINATHLNLEQNFAFYGLATGTYYVIIESSYPSSIAKNKKIYIAKKIKVDKYKKIMTVFSKRL